MAHSVSAFSLLLYRSGRRRFTINQADSSSHFLGLQLAHWAVANPNCSRRTLTMTSAELLFSTPLQKATTVLTNECLTPHYSSSDIPGIALLRHQ